MFTGNLGFLNFGESSLKRGSGGREMEGNYSVFNGRRTPFAEFRFITVRSGRWCVIS